MPNLSVWIDLGALRAFAYDTVHRYFLQQRRRWFARTDEPHLVLRRVPAGYRSTLAEAEARLRFLEARGPTADAFTFQETVDPAGRPSPRGRDGAGA